MHWSSVALSLFLAVSVFAATPAEPRVVSKEKQGFGTRVRVALFTADEAGASAAIDAAFAELERLEALLSEWRPTSDISRINQNAGKEPVKVAPETLALVTRGVEINRLTSGAFALSWAALKGLWDFSPTIRSGRVPSPEAVKARLVHIDDTKIQIDPAASTVAIASGMAIGVGAIAEGFALDKLRALLAARGYPDSLVFIGGDIAASGSKGGKPWTVGIQDPRGQGFFAMLSPKDEAVTTSGDYEKFFELEGVRYAHVLDPRTGQPARGCRSVTVVSKDATLADALATAIMVLGPVQGMRLVESLDGVEVVIVDAENNVSLSPGLKNRVRMVRAPTP